MKPHSLISLIILISLICSSAHAQTVTRQLYGTAGSNAVAINGTYYVNWSMGEPVIHTLNNGLPQLTQGFQQPEIIIPLEVDRLELAVRRSGNDAFLSWKDYSSGSFVYQVAMLQVGTGWQQLGNTSANIFRHYDISGFNGSLLYRITAQGQDGSIRHSNRVELNLEQSGTPTLFPNPTTGILNINGLVENSHLQLYDMTGKLLKDQISPFQDFQFDLGEYPAGTYLLRVWVGEQRYAYKVELISE